MSGLQKLLTSIFPKKWADGMRAESERWIITCTGCGRSGSIWQAGGIRWKAASKGKSMLVNCSKCGGLKKATVEYQPDAKSSAE